TVLHLRRIFKEPALWRTRSTRAVAVIRSAMAGTHEQTGLRKPADRTTQVRAIDRKNLKLLAFDATHPACGIDCLAIGRHHVGIPECSQPRLAFWKFAHGPERYPRQVGVRAPSCNGGQKEP